MRFNKVYSYIPSKDHSLGLNSLYLKLKRHAIVIEFTLMNPSFRITVYKLKP